MLGSADSSIYAADARTQKCKLAVKGHCGGAVLSLAMHPTKQLLFSVGEDGLVTASPETTRPQAPDPDP